MADPPYENDETIKGYEACALEYARSTAPRPGEQFDEAALVALQTVVSEGGCVLEIGSGPGWDADWLEGNGFCVRRTDAATAFVNFQQRRGKSAERLNLLRDPLGGPYDGIMARYVLQHVDRTELPTALEKIAKAIRSGGALLISVREGAGETLEKGKNGHGYYVAAWQRDELLAFLEPLGLGLLWSNSSTDNDGQWLSALFRKAPS